MSSIESYIHLIVLFVLVAVVAVLLAVGGAVHFKTLKQSEQNTEKLMSKRSFLIMVASGACILLLLFSIFGCSVKEYVTRTYELNGDFDNINLHLDDANVDFKLSDDGKCKVVCKELEDSDYNIFVENGCLNIESDDSKKWRLTLFSFSSAGVTVYLPRDAYKSLEIDNVTGNIAIPSGLSFESIQINATTGNIDISGISCSGDIVAEVTTGNIELTDITCRNFVCESTTGDIEMSDVVATGRFSIEVTTGDVKLRGCDASEVYVDSTPGDITAEFLTEKTVYADTTTGDIDVPRGTRGGPCEIETTTGNIKVTIKN